MTDRLTRTICSPRWPGPPTNGLLGPPGFPIAALIVSRGLLRNPAWSPARQSLLWTVGLNWVGLLAFVVTVAFVLPAAAGSGLTRPIG